MRNFSDMNDLDNFQNTCLFCKIIKNRFGKMHKMYDFNIQRYSLASTLSVCIERDLSKLATALPAYTDLVEMFQKILTGGFSCINTRLVFDAEILLPNHSQADINKMNIDGSFKSYKRQDLKLV